MSLAASLVAAFLPLNAVSWGQSDVSWLRTRSLANALNPNLSVIGDFTGIAGPMGDGTSNRFALREAEIGLQAAVDPYARADVFVAVPEGERAELEEAYLTLLSLPWGIRLRGGKFLANFGRMNMTHQHERPQVDAPLAVDQYLGAEGLNDTGLEASRIFDVFGVFTEASYAVLNGLGPAAEREPVTTTVQDVNNNQVTVRVEPADGPERRAARNFAHVSRLRAYADLTDAANVELGLSGAIHQPKGRKHTRMGGLDLTLRWKPLEQAIYRSFIWRAEGFYSNRRLTPEVNAVTGAVDQEARELDRRGLYSYAEYQPLRRWRFGGRWDYSEDPEAMHALLTRKDSAQRRVGKSITRAFAPYIAFTLSEFQKLRTEYQYRRNPAGDDEHRAFLQWTFVLGPHGAHAF